MANAFCKSCDRDVGVKVERPKGAIWSCIIAAVVSFVWLVSQAEVYYSVSGRAVTASGPGDGMLIIPIGFLIIAVYAATKMAVRKCAICGSQLIEEKGNA